MRKLVESPLTNEQLAGRWPFTFTTRGLRSFYVPYGAPGAFGTITKGGTTFRCYPVVYGNMQMHGSQLDSPHVVEGKPTSTKKISAGAAVDPRSTPYDHVAAAKEEKERRRSKDGSKRKRQISGSATSTTKKKSTVGATAGAAAGAGDNTGAITVSTQDLANNGGFGEPKAVDKRDKEEFIADDDNSGFGKANIVKPDERAELAKLKAALA